jgi:hypothetical protein
MKLQRPKPQTRLRCRQLTTTKLRILRVKALVAAGGNARSGSLLTPVFSSSVQAVDGMGER